MLGDRCKLFKRCLLSFFKAGGTCLVFCGVVVFFNSDFGIGRRQKVFFGRIGVDDSVDHLGYRNGSHLNLVGTVEDLVNGGGA